MKKRLLKVFLSVMLLFGVSFVHPLLTTSNVYAEEPDYLNDWSGLDDYLDPAEDSNSAPAESPNNTNQDENGEPSTTPPDNWEDYLDDWSGLDDYIDDPNSAGTSGGTNGSPSSDTPICQSESGSTAWVICAAMSTAGNLVDGFYSLIEHFLMGKPISTDHSSGTYQIWSYMRTITNVVFIIFMIVVIYSQLTGLGISNYGVKKALPRLIIAIILVNLSYTIASIAVDISNVIGGSLTGLLGSIQQDAMAHIDTNVNLNVSWVDFTTYLTAGTAIAGVAIVGFAGIEAVFWAVVLGLIGAVISLAIGLITIALRQGLVLILVMISPLAFVAYLLPNTEKWYEKWKSLLFQMLVFYPMFSLLFGASKLAGWAIIATANQSPVEILIGLIVQVMPIFFSFSLFKMSGTILGNVNSALQKLSMPMRGGLAGWAGSHQELARARYLGNPALLPGQHLRKYLDKRRAQRELDTAAATKMRTDRALEGAYHKIANDRGSDAKGNDVFARANRSTQLHKYASLQSTLTANAKKSLENNLSDYGNIYRSHAAARLSAMHGAAILESMKQEFRAENIAQGDQDYLLGSYLNATANRDSTPYEYNRLVRSANGGIGHRGESSIIGQVLIRSAEIEGRRRREALVVKNKFNLPKTEFRAMIFDKAFINDNGYETDENGIVLEDDQYRLKPELAHRHKTWQHYIGVHLDTGQEITKEEYDALSDTERSNYSKVRYMDIYDDKGKPVQRVYDDEAGYMKELLINDVAIGDPINRRYNISYGLAHTPNEESGILRRYHSTISTAMRDTKYKEHSAEVTSMLMAQANMGYITSIGQYNIANLQSLISSKAGDLLKNDPYALDSWAKLVKSVNCVEPGETFEDYFPDEDIMSYRDVNGNELDGYRLAFDANGNPYWEEINHNDPTITIEERRNYVKHKIIPKAASLIIGMLNRDMTPSVLEAQKPGSLKSLLTLQETLSVLGIENADPDTPFLNRLDPNGQLFSSQDAHILKRNIQNTKAQIEMVKGRTASAKEMIAAVKDKDHAAHAANDTLLLSRLLAQPELIHQIDKIELERLRKAYPAQISQINRLNGPLARANADAMRKAGMRDASQVIDMMKEDLVYYTDPESTREAIKGFFDYNDYLRDYTEQIDAIYDSIFVNTAGGYAGLSEAEQIQGFENEVYSFIDQMLGARD